MQNDQKVDLRTISQSDQRDAAVKDIATLLGMFYSELKKNAIPDNLAESLVLDYHDAIINRVQKNAGGPENE